MNRLVKYDPYDPFANVERAMNRMRWSFDGDMTQALDIDMVSNEGDIVVRTALPGVKEDEVQVDVRDNVLTISAESQSSREANNQNWYLREMRYGKFSRSVPLPEGVQVDHAEAKLENGILTVTLPREKPSPVHNIIVKAKKLLSGDKNS